jgi:hypothetical protein
LFAAIRHYPQFSVPLFKVTSLEPMPGLPDWRRQMKNIVDEDGEIIAKATAARRSSQRLMTLKPLRSLPVEIAPTASSGGRTMSSITDRLFGMPLALLRSQLISISVPQPHAYRKAQASAVRFANGYRRSVQN